MTFISINDLSHKYITYRKNQGFRGTIKDFFHRSIEYRFALKDINLTIKQGEMVGLLGANGAGKTTLMKILAGLIYPTQGSVTVMGEEPYKKSKRYLRQIGLVLGQKSQLTWDLPPSDTLVVLKEIYRVKDQDYNERLNFLLSTLDITERLNIPVRKLSLGERMKFELIAALIHQPQLLLLDEPTIGLDLTSQRAIHTFLRSLNRIFGTTIILTSHYIKDIEALADRLVILKEGEIHYNGSLNNLLNSHQDLKIIRVETNEDLAEHILGFNLISKNLWECVVPPSELNRTLEILARDVTILNITTQDKPLEEVLYTFFSHQSETEEKTNATAVL